MILLIDALDSFTYNLVQAFQALGEEVEVARFDQITLDDVRARNPELIVLSPGPGHPTECKIHIDIAASNLGIPVFGVCLGQQALAAGSGGRVTRRFLARPFLRSTGGKLGVPQGPRNRKFG